MGRGQKGSDGPDKVGLGSIRRPVIGLALGGAAAQRQPDYRPPDTAEAHLVGTIGALLAAPHPVIQHRKFSLRAQSMRYGLAPLECTASMVYAAFGSG